jgi:hypothetical protein
MNKRKQQQHEQWAAAQVARLLADPYHTGIRVNPGYTKKISPEDRAMFIRSAEKKIHELGAESFLRKLLNDLRSKTMWCLIGIQVHECFTRDRPARITEEQFIKAGVVQIQEIGAQKYLAYFLDNLENDVRMEEP